MGLDGPLEAAETYACEQDMPARRRAGTEGFRPRRLRHTAALRWLAAGGSESGLIATPGRTRVETLISYARAHAGARRRRGQAPRPRKVLTARSRGRQCPSREGRLSVARRPRCNTLAV
ncbi:hypothetical protein GCM10028801_28770 [Nocardioides maradonensis]